MTRKLALAVAVALLGVSACKNVKPEAQHLPLRSLSPKRRLRPSRLFNSRRPKWRLLLHLPKRRHLRPSPLRRLHPLPHHPLRPSRRLRLLPP